MKKKKTRRPVGIFAKRETCFGSSVIPENLAKTHTAVEVSTVEIQNGLRVEQIGLARNITVPGKKKLIFEARFQSPCCAKYIWIRVTIPQEVLRNG